MKINISITSILGMIFLLGVANTSIIAQPTSFTFTTTNSFAIFQGQAQIAGFPASNGDWIAAFDQTGACVGANPIIINQGIAYINLSIFGDDNTTVGVKDGMTSGENFFLQLWDSSAQVILDYPNSSNPTAFPNWTNTFGLPLTGYPLTTIYNFLLTPPVSFITPAPVCDNTAPFQMIGGSPAGGRYIGAGMLNDSIFDPALVGPGGSQIGYIYSDSSISFVDTVYANIFLFASPSISFPALPTRTSTDPAFNLPAASPPGGTYSGPGIIQATAGTFDPGLVGAGSYTIQYAYTNVNGCSDTASQTILVTSPFTPFTWTPTNGSGVLLGQAQIEGVPADSMDWVGAFDSNNNCVGASRLIFFNGNAYINLPIYGDDISTPMVDEGMNVGEYFTLQLYRAADSSYLNYPTTFNPVQFTQWANTFGTPMPAYNNPADIYNWRFSKTDTIILKAGWNQISFDVVPADTLLDSVFSTLKTGNMEYVTGFDQGSIFYDPNGLPFLNTLSHITRGYGYWVKVALDDTLIIEGDEISPSYKRNLDAGWNMFGYIPQPDSTPTDYFGPLISGNHLQYVTGFDNGSQFFDPNGLPILNTLQALRNGFGYYVRVDSAIQGTNYRFGDLDVNPSPTFDFFNGQSNLPQGAQVQILNSQDQVCGILKVLESGYLQTGAAYGDDPFTPEHEGLYPGEIIRFRCNNQILTSDILFDGNMTVHQVRLSFNPGSKLLIKPNPAQDQVSISFDLNQANMIRFEILDFLGKSVWRSLSQKGETGYNVIALPLDMLPNGTYILRMISEGGSFQSTKLTIQR